MCVASGPLISYRNHVRILIPFLFTSSLCQGALVINEFLPDPAGSDGGREYVELLNNGPLPLDLLTVRLEFANGAVAAEWVTRWSGADVVLAAGARFLLVDRNWLGPDIADVEVYLGLQNGPDAIRIVRGTEVLDLVGYGPLTDAALFEGRAVPLVAGRALARRPDGADTDDNWSDFVSADLTPGAPNFDQYSFVVQEVSWDPPQLSRPGGALHLNLVLKNDGVEILPGRWSRVFWGDDEVQGWCDQTLPDGLRTLSFILRPQDRGVVGFRWEYVVPATDDTLGYDLGRVQVGAPSLRLNEVMPVPGQGQGEWVELQWLGSQPERLLDYALRDEDGSWRKLPDVSLRPGQFAVVVEDSAAFVAWQRLNVSRGAINCSLEPAEYLVVSLSAWPLLNNSPPASRLFADRIFLADPAGVVLDAVSWGGREHEQPDRDLSLARIGREAVSAAVANWTVSTSQYGSTPGCANSVTAGEFPSLAEDMLVAEPPLLDRAAGTSSCHIRFVLADAELSWSLRIFNLWGDQVRDFGGDERGPGPRDLIWNGADDRGALVLVGAYVVWLEVRGAAGGISRRQKIRLVVR